MKKYRVSVIWEGENEVEDYFESEEEAEEYGYDHLADGCGSCTVYVKEIENKDGDE